MRPCARCGPRPAPSALARRICKVLVVAMATTAGLFAPTGAQAQVGKYADFIELILTTKDSQDVRYVKSFKLRWSPRVYIQNKYASFGFRPRGVFSQQQQYYPNVSASIGIGLYYESFGASYSFSFGSNDSRDKRLGQTRALDFGINSYQRRFVVDASYQRYQGFYISKPAGIGGQRVVDKTYAQRSDIVYQSIGLGYIHITNHYRFSFQAGIWQSRKQVRSAGSVLWLMGLTYTTIHGDSGILARRTSKTNAATDSIRFNNGHFLLANILPGYGHTFVVGHLYVMGALFAGPTLQYQNYRSDTDPTSGERILHTENKVSVGGRFNFRGALGYNGEKYFAALLTMADVQQSAVEGIRLQTQSISTSVQVGFRF